MAETVAEARERLGGTTPLPDKPIAGPGVAGKGEAAAPSFWGRPTQQHVEPVPEVNREYPKLMYHPDPEKRKAKSLVSTYPAKNAEEEAQAREQGWVPFAELDKDAQLAHAEFAQGHGKERLKTSGSPEIEPQQEPDPEVNAPNFSKKKGPKAS